MNRYVVDSCIGVKWFFNEAFTENANALLDGYPKLYAPDLFLLEISNVLCKRIRQKDLTIEKAEKIRDSLHLKSTIEFHSFTELIDVAFRIASETGSSLYDCFYIALAIKQKCPLITSDKRLYKNISATPFGKHILWIEDVA